MQGFAADPDYWKGEVFAYVRSIQNLKDLKDRVQGQSTGVAEVFGSLKLVWPTSRGEGDPSVFKVGNPKKLAFLVRNTSF